MKPNSRITRFLLFLLGVHVALLIITSLLRVISGNYELASDHVLIDILTVIVLYNIFTLIPIIATAVIFSIYCLIVRQFNEVVYLVLVGFGIWYSFGLIHSHYEIWRSNPVRLKELRKQGISTPNHQLQWMLAIARPTELGRYASKEK